MPAGTFRVRWNRLPTASLEGKRYDEEWINKNETAKYYAHQLKGLINGIKTYKGQWNGNLSMHKILNISPTYCLSFVETPC